AALTFEKPANQTLFLLWRPPPIEPGNRLGYVKLRDVVGFGFKFGKQFAKAVRHTEFAQDTNLFPSHVAARVGETSEHVIRDLRFCSRVERGFHEHHHTQKVKAIFDDERLL